MILAIPLLVLAGLQFTQQDLPPWDYAEYPFTYFELADQFHQADLNGDKQPDLILPSVCFLQKNGLFDVSTPIQPPQFNENCYCDLWGDSLVLWSREKLRVVRLDGGKWRVIFEQEMPWPEDSDLSESFHAGIRNKSLSFQFSRFLHDFDSDGVPEIGVPIPNGLQIYRKVGGKYEKAAVLPIFPPLEVRIADQSLWPRAARRVILPYREMSCTFLIEGNRLTVSSKENGTQEMPRYRTKQFVIEPQDATYTLRPTGDALSGPLPSVMYPTRLNADDQIDYVGVAKDPLPTSPSRVLVSTNGGRTIQTFRAFTLNTLPSYFIDLDGDGDLDLALDNSRVFEGGARESITRFLTRRDVSHEIDIYLQGGDGVFPSTPDAIVRLEFRLESPPVGNCFRLFQYSRGALRSWKGDFDGDGRRDLLVYDQPERLAVYLNKSSHFSGDPDALISVPLHAKFDVVEINGDGRSDIIISWEQNEKYYMRLYLST